jgi:hypothetical protein
MPIPGIFLLASLLVAGCSHTSDARRYVEASQSGDYAPARKLCQAINDPDLRSECIADLARLFGREHLDQVVNDCAGLPEGPWRDECHFYLAESWADVASSMSTEEEEPGEPGESATAAFQQAAATCGQTDGLAPNCVMHIWAVLSRYLMGIVEQRPGVQEAPTLQSPLSEQAAPSLIAARPAVDWSAPDAVPTWQKRVLRAMPTFRSAIQWAPMAGLQLDENLEDRAWAQFFQEAFKGQDPLDITACVSAEWDSRSQGWCNEAQVIRLAQELNNTIRAASDTMTQCCASAMSAGTPDLTSARSFSSCLGVRYTPAALLDRLTLSKLKRICSNPPQSSEGKP